MLLGAGQLVISWSVGFVDGVCGAHRGINSRIARRGCLGMGGVWPTEYDRSRPLSNDTASSFDNTILIGARFKVRLSNLILVGNRT